MLARFNTGRRAGRRHGARERVDAAARGRPENVQFRSDLDSVSGQRLIERSFPPDVPAPAAVVRDDVLPPRPLVPVVVTVILAAVLCAVAGTGIRSGGILLAEPFGTLVLDAGQREWWPAQDARR